MINLKINGVIEVNFHEHDAVDMWRNRLIKMAAGFSHR